MGMFVIQEIYPKSFNFPEGAICFRSVGDTLTWRDDSSYEIVPISFHGPLQLVFTLKVSMEEG